MNLRTAFRYIAGVLLSLGLALAACGVQAEYKGVRVCIKCHVEQGDSWRKTAHAKAFESLRPGVKASAKAKAGLDPAKDYASDGNCVGCHVTGYGAEGGYRRGMPEDDAKVLVGVTCESCHGAGGAYRDKHGEALDKLKTTGATSDRRVLVESGQNFDYEKACLRCHANATSGVAPTAPHSPFVPSLDAKYAFDFNRAVRTGGDRNPIHTHFKLRGVFVGDSAPAIRAELQESALEPEE